MMRLMSELPQEPLDVTIGDEDVEASGRRCWLGIQFECCGVYARVYRNSEGTSYVGLCPRCGGRVRVPIGPDGTDTRFFRAR